MVKNRLKEITKKSLLRNLCPKKPWRQRNLKRKRHLLLKKKDKGRMIQNSMDVDVPKKGKEASISSKISIVARMLATKRNRPKTNNDWPGSPETCASFLFLK